MDKKRERRPVDKKDRIKNQLARDYSPDELRVAGIRCGKKGRPYTTPHGVRDILDQGAAEKLSLIKDIRESIESGVFPKNLLSRLWAKGMTVPIKDGFYVYVLRDKKECILYVGKTTNVCRRVGQHQDSGKRFDAVNVFECKDKKHMEDLEREMIRAFKPPLNQVMYLS